MWLSFYSDLLIFTPEFTPQLFGMIRFYYFHLSYEVINILINPVVLFFRAAFAHITVTNPIQINNHDIILFLF